MLWAGHLLWYYILLNGGGFVAAFAISRSEQHMMMWIAAPPSFCYQTAIYSLILLFEMGTPGVVNNSNCPQTFVRRRRKKEWEKKNIAVQILFPASTKRGS
jgi:hypothetical protein